MEQLISDPRFPYWIVLVAGVPFFAWLLRVWWNAFTENRANGKALRKRLQWLDEHPNDNPMGLPDELAVRYNTRTRNQIAEQLGMKERD